MKRTIDTLTGKPFRWNEVVLYMGFYVPGRMTSRTADHLHPSRVPEKLLAKLNDGRTWAGYHSKEQP